ncbi:hypothetical protein [Cryobacterium sp. PH29-G1]|uniref:hypothetical protein n=1 Tax=Cryobacterium sp. PH29-G1 TaxID=3046211 RepID=UPI0024BB2F83|nr:hypothetical protein [Cryobacterium sp. PH29-G1]MDJ0348778.1 hypothetical protein [Cryobacterium sp. PH29-G1]
MKKRTLTAAVTALSLAGVMLLAAPAQASPGNVTNESLLCGLGGGVSSSSVDTATTSFNYVCQTSGSISDARTEHTTDAYDGFGYVGTTNADESQYLFTADTYEVDGTTFTFVDTDVYNSLTDGFVDAHVTRTFVGNTATWTVDVFEAGTDIPADMPLFITGNLGSDGDSTYTPYDTFLLSTDTGIYDPYLLWKSTGEASYVNGNDTLSFDFGVASSARLENILIGYEACADPAALPTLLTSIDADWLSYANTEIAEISSEQQCFDVVGTTTFTRGVAVDTTLTFDGYDNFDWTHGGYAQIGDLPAGLEAEVLNTWSDDETPPTIHIFGTPTTVGAVDTYIYLADDEGMDADRALTLTVINEPVAADLTLNASVGALIAGSDITYSASGLQDGAAWTLTLRSTPQVIGNGFVTSTGTVSGVATIPAGLETGWHSITLDSTDNTGTTLSRVVYFEIDAAGQLLSSNYTGIPVETAAPVDTIVDAAVAATTVTAVPAVEAELAATGFSGSTGALGALALTLAGVLLFGAALRRKHRTA